MVVEEHLPSLLSLDWFGSLGFGISGVSLVQNADLDILEQEFPSIFDGKLETYSGKLVSFNLDLAVAPVRLKPRCIPFALKSKVNAELDKLIGQGVLEPVDHSKWETPIVTLIKPDGSIHLCTDYKCTINHTFPPINHTLPANAYPVHVVQHLLHSLGKILSPCMTHWTVFLGAYNYQLSYRLGKHISHVDALSRCPLPETLDDPAPELQVLLIEDLHLPITAADIARYSSREPVISRVLDWALRGWPQDPVAPEFLPYFTCHSELSVQKGCLLWGQRVVAPLPLRTKVFDMLHSGHPGIVHMKAFGLSYLWWPKLDTSIIEWVNGCHKCQESWPSPPKVPAHKWETPSTPWPSIHIHFVGPFQVQVFLVVVDTYSKWLEIVLMTSPLPRQWSEPCAGFLQPMVCPT